MPIGLSFFVHISVKLVAVTDRKSDGETNKNHLHF